VRPAAALEAAGQPEQHRLDAELLVATSITDVIAPASAETAMP
jgi:hypothetical protein